MPGSAMSVGTSRGKLAAVLRHDLLGRGVQAASAAVVAQALPQAQHLLLVGGRKRLDCRKRRDETLEIRLHCRNGRLLQHHLADPHAIGIARPPPRQVAGVLAVPREQPPAKRCALTRRRELLPRCSPLPCACRGRGRPGSLAESHASFERGHQFDQRLLAVAEEHQAIVGGEQRIGNARRSPGSGFA